MGVISYSASVPTYVSEREGGDRSPFPEENYGDGLIIGRDMSVSEAVKRLVLYGCKDVTSSLNLARCDELPTEVGSFGDLYHGAFHKGHLVAIRCLQPTVALDTEGQQVLERAANELQAWSRCHHPNVLELLGVAHYHGQLALVSHMEYGNLLRFLSQDPPAQVDLYKLCIQIADGLAYLRQEILMLSLVRSQPAESPAATYIHCQPIRVATAAPSELLFLGERLWPVV
ncbi:unnamed protein product [Rhizoctonia solani]|uniref:Protein kinase domain-containing protein n=1 Tax=Rhizoctonia solani TaxID=456999 RepID=A0A8H3E2W8_9AGAM|nr:unnamed protein product [Rhizoctonia solani]